MATVFLWIPPTPPPAIKFGRLQKKSPPSKTLMHVVESKNNISPLQPGKRLYIICIHIYIYDLQLNEPTHVNWYCMLMVVIGKSA